MRATNTFLFLTFIIIVIVILSSETLTEAVLTISLLANFFAISTHFTRMFNPAAQLDIDEPRAPAPKPAPNPDSAAPPEPPKSPEMPPNAYGPFFEIHDAYNRYSDEYTGPVVAASGAERTYNIDMMNTVMAQKRARDKRCSDGWVTKNADYYRYNFAGELDQAENKRWWGANEW